MPTANNGRYYVVHLDNGAIGYIHADNHRSVDNDDDDRRAVLYDLGAAINRELDDHDPSAAVSHDDDLAAAFRSADDAIADLHRAQRDLADAAASLRAARHRMMKAENP